MTKSARCDNRYAGLLRLTVCALLLLIFNTVAAASSLEEYQKRLASAQAAVGGLLEIDPSTDGISALQQEMAGQIRGDLPAQMIVDWRGGSAAIDNMWLHSELDAFAAEVNLSKQDIVLTRIQDRLAAIELAVAEASSSIDGENSKDENKRKLAEILLRQEYQKPAAESESLFQRLRRQLIEWLRSMFPSVNIEPREPAAGLGSLARVLQVLLYLALAAGILYLLYKFIPYFARRPGRDKAAVKNERVILGERVAAETSSADLFSEAERLARDGELRLAIRKGYVALLCELSDRKLIGLARHKTNSDYLSDLRPRRELFENVRGLTGSFERHWYGSEVSAEKDWDEFRALYRETVAKA